MAQYRLLGISGSLRKEATNRKLVADAARLFDPAEFINADLQLPWYDGDVEVASGIPKSVQVLVEAIDAADAVVISGPEYNGSVSGVLKNALDWVSRSKVKPWKGKPVAILSAAAGRSGGARTQSVLRLCMNPFRARVLAGPEVMVASAGNAFDADGRLINEQTVKGLTELMDALRAEIGR